MLQHDHIWQALRALSLMLMVVLIGCGTFAPLRPHRQRLLGGALAIYVVVGGGLLLWVWLRPG